MKNNLKYRLSALLFLASALKNIRSLLFLSRTLRDLPASRLNV